MSLNSKFAVLLLAIALTIGLVLGAAISFGRLLERELAWPFEESTALLQKLAELRGLALDTPAQTTTPGDSGEVPAEHTDAPMQRMLAALQQDPVFQRRAGVTATSAIVLAWENVERAGNDAPARQAALAQLRVVIERLESRVLNDAPAAIAYQAEQREAYRQLIFAGAVATSLIALLGIVLMRRWVIAPVRALRDATVRIGTGDFEHRVPVRSSDELGALSAEVNRMAGLIRTMQNNAIERERLAATGEMVRRIVHNLRNPLAAIRSTAELSRRRAARDEAVRKDQSEIIDAVDRFDGWLSDLLRVNAPLSLTRVEQPVGPWVHAVVEGVLPMARSRGVTIDVRTDEAPASASFDARHLEQALVGVLVNAIQASPTGGTVTVTARTIEGRWELSVRDQGPGVPPDLEEKVFRPYFTTKRDGTGIGLAVALQVARGHGGEIAVVRDSSPGACFAFRVPIGNDRSNPPRERNQPAEISRMG